MTTLSDIEKYFKENGIPSEPWRVDAGSVCFDTKLMVATHIATWKMYEGNKIFLPYWTRLKGYYEYCVKLEKN